MATITQDNYVGTTIRAAAAGEVYDGPLPKVLKLARAAYRPKGIHVGYRWYLQTFGDGPSVMVQPEEDLYDGACQAFLGAWLKANGYTYDDYPGSFEYTR